MPLALLFYPKYFTVPRVRTLLVGLNPAGVTLQVTKDYSLCTCFCACVCVCVCVCVCMCE